MSVIKFTPGCKKDECDCNYEPRYILFDRCMDNNDIEHILNVSLSR